MMLIMLRLVANTFLGQKIESVHFTQAPRQNSPPDSYHYPRGKRNVHISLE